MALNIKNAEVEQLAADVAQMTGETKTEAIRRALADRKARLAFKISGSRGAERCLRYLEEEVWPAVPAEELGRRLSKAEEEEILGFDP